MATTYLTKRITVDPEVCHGKPCIRGMRIMVSDVLDLLAAGIPPQEIISDDNYPDLELEDVYSCIAFANQMLQREELHVVSLLPEAA
jgi:uncharacterized protein (DUF433 family)